MQGRKYMNAEEKQYAEMFKKHGVKYNLADAHNVSRETSKRKIRHQDVTREFLRAIATSTMPIELKSFLRLRFWGKNPRKFCPLTCEQISYMMGIRIETIEAMEEEAKGRLKDHISSFHVSDSDIKAVQDNLLNKNLIIGNDGKPIR